jgi:UPF0716 protein FxsA
MQLGLFMIFVAVPLIEIGLLIKLGQWIGFTWTLFLVISTALAGGYVLHTQGLQVVRRALETISKGQAPIAPIIDGSFLMLAGALLIAPGVMTDITGALLLIPPLRKVVSVWAIQKLLATGSLHTNTFGTAPHNGSSTGSGQRTAEPRPSTASTNAGQGPVIDGEFERLDERTINPNRPPPPR